MPVVMVAAGGEHLWRTVPKVTPKISQAARLRDSLQTRSGREWEAPKMGRESSISGQAQREQPGHGRLQPLTCRATQHPGSELLDFLSPMICKAHSPWLWSWEGPEKSPLFLEQGGSFHPRNPSLSLNLSKIWSSCGELTQHHWSQILHYATISLYKAPTSMPTPACCSCHISLGNAAGRLGEGENAMVTSVRHCAEDFACLFSLYPNKTAR